jgi:tetratricopeptide (TPR) repeat protein
MEGVQEARALLMQQRFKEAGALLDRLILDKGDDSELWYLRGMVSLKMRNYDAAMECFERALLISRRSRYYQIKGMAHFEMLEIKEALEAFRHSLAMEPNDAVSHFFISLCYMLQDDPRCGRHLQMAYDSDPRKTRQLLTNFYTLFLQNDPRLTPAQKSQLELRMKSLG